MARTLARVAADFRRELPARLARAQALLRACLDAPVGPWRQADLKALVLLLHALAGTAGTLGMEAVGDAAREAERAAQALGQGACEPGSWDESGADMQALHARLVDLAARIDEAIAEAPPGP